MCVSSLPALPRARTTGQLHLLHLQNNQLEELPSSLLELASLTELFLSDNQLTHISFPSWGALSRLRLLVLGGNRLTSVRTLAGLTGLVELDLHGNRLTALPGGLALCEHLAMVRFDRNRITHLSPGLPNMCVCHPRRRKFLAHP